MPRPTKKMVKVRVRHSKHVVRVRVRMRHSKYVVRVSFICGLRLGFGEALQTLG